MKECTTRLPCNQRYCVGHCAPQPDGAPPRMNASHRRRVKRLINDVLADISSKYQDSIPLVAIQETLSTYGLHLEPGIYTGRDGKSLEPVGEDLYLSLTWHKLEVTGQWEIVAYIS